MGIIEWEGEYKDLRFIKGYSPEEILIVDDDQEYILPDQKEHWIPILPYEPPGEDPWISSEKHPPLENDTDQELFAVLEILQNRVE